MTGKKTFKQSAKRIVVNIARECIYSTYLFEQNVNITTTCKKETITQHNWFNISYMCALLAIEILFI